MTHRVFIAINLPQKVREEMGRLLASLKRDLKRASINPPTFPRSKGERTRDREIFGKGGGIKWATADKIHVTLHFLGDLTDEQIEEVGGILAKIAPKYGKFKLKLGQIGFFPHKFRPRIVFVDTECPDEIGYLQAEIGKELENLGYEIDSRPWHPHLTLGRVSGSVHAKDFEKQEIHPMEFEASSMDLMESELKPEGAEYKLLKSFKFQ